MEPRSTVRQGRPKFSFTHEANIHCNAEFHCWIQKDQKHQKTHRGPCLERVCSYIPFGFLGMDANVCMFTCTHSHTQTCASLIFFLVLIQRRAQMTCSSYWMNQIMALISQVSRCEVESALLKLPSQEACPRLAGPLWYLPFASACLPISICAFAPPLQLVLCLDHLHGSWQPVSQNVLPLSRGPCSEARGPSPQTSLASVPSGCTPAVT